MMMNSDRIREVTDMKPKHVDFGETYGEMYQCGKCLESEIYSRYNFCPMCGERIDWEGVTWTETKVEYKAHTHKSKIVHKARE